MKILSFEGGRDRNLSYLIHDKKESIVIDPFKNIKIYEKKAEDLKVKIIGIINTHLHIDHVEGNEQFKEKGVKIINLENKEMIKLGNEEIKIIKTPGHSKDCKCFLIDGNLFTGDVLLAKRIGMAFTKEDTPILYKSIQKLKKLPKTTTIWPGHYYNSEFPFTLKEELERNPYLKASNLEEFTELIDKWREYMVEWRKKREKAK